MKNILLIIETQLVREFLESKLKEKNVGLIVSHNGLDGSIKMRSAIPDLIVMDYFLSRKSSAELLGEKAKNKDLQSVPVIVMGPLIGKNELNQLAVLGVKKFFPKPLKMDAILKGISELAGLDVSIDISPCLLDAHLNDDILFIELAQGLNSEKIDLLDLKIQELKKLNGQSGMKVLLMISNLALIQNDMPKLQKLMETILKSAGIGIKNFRVLTANEAIGAAICKLSGFEKILVTKNLEEAVEGFVDKAAPEVSDKVKDKIVNSLSDSRTDTVALRFESEQNQSSLGEKLKLTRDSARIAVVDDDFAVREVLKKIFESAGWTVALYENGMLFTNDLGEQEFDLVFLDLLMPDMDGFEVLNFLKKHGLQMPVIVLSALTRKETVLKAMTMGIRSYLTKPVMADKILKKVTEVMTLNV